MKTILALIPLVALGAFFLWNAIGALRTGCIAAPLSSDVAGKSVIKRNVAPRSSGFRVAIYLLGGVACVAVLAFALMNLIGAKHA